MSEGKYIRVRWSIWFTVLTSNDDKRDDEPNVDEADKDNLANHKQQALKQEFKEEWNTDIHC